MRPLALIAFLLIVLPWRAEAEEKPPPCVAGSPSFATTDVNRLSCESFTDMRAKGATLVMIRRHAERPNCELRITRPATDRKDGSFVQFCEVRCQPQGRVAMGFDWRPCAADGSTGRTTGVSVCKNGIWCGGALGLKREAETCIALHRDGDRYAFAWVSGRRSCLPGDVTFKPR